MKFLVKNKIYTYSIILSFIIITVIRLITVDHNIPSKLFMDACIQSCICICADLAWNAPGVGGKFASRYIKDDQSFVWALVAALVPSVYYAIILNFTGLYLSFGEFIPGFFNMYIKGMPLSFIVGYIASIFVTYAFKYMENKVGKHWKKTINVIIYTR